MHIPLKSPGVIMEDERHFEIPSLATRCRHRTRQKTVLNINAVLDWEWRLRTVDNAQPDRANVLPDEKNRVKDLASDKADVMVRWANSPQVPFSLH